MTGIGDIHTHIIPAVDDGAASFDEAYRILEDEISQGVERIMLTPHYRTGMFETPENEIYVKAKQLIMEAQSRYPMLEVKLGCEFHAVMDMEEKLKERRFATLNQSSVLLLELSARHTKSFVKERCMTALSEGYSLVLAHIERIPALAEDFDFIHELKRHGIMMQINADSVLGTDGRAVKSLCRKFIKAGFTDFIASDVHNMTSRRSNIGKCADFVEKKYGTEYAERIFVENPKMLFD